jgi:tricorn protease
MRQYSWALVVCVLAGSATAQPIKRIKFPAISPDGSRIVFSWQDDLWSVSAQGGRAERLTVHAAADTRPRWFPDGSRIAFASTRFGSADVFTMKPDGSEVKRLTFDSASEFPNDISPDGRFIYGQTTAFGRSDLFRVGSNGGDLVRLTDHVYEAEFLPVLTPDAKTVIYNRGAYGQTSWQKPGVKSASLPEIWAADNTVPLSNHRRLTNNETTDLGPRIGGGSMTYISNADGWPNVWRAGANGSNPRRLTRHKDGTARNLTVSADGRWVAYELNSELFLLDTRSSETKKLEVTVPSDQRQNPKQEISLNSGLSDYAVSPDGKRAVIVLRGDLFLIPERGGTTRRLTTNLSWDFQPIWLDNKTILYVTASESKREFRKVTIDGKIEPFLPSAADLTHPQLSPDGKWLAFHRGDTEIVAYAMPVAQKPAEPKEGEAKKEPAPPAEPKVILKGNFSDALDGTAMFSWSPDSKWLVANVLEGRRLNVTLASVESDKKIVAARMVFRPQLGVYSPPRFLPNGRGVYLLSPEVGTNVDLFLVDLVPQELSFTEDDLDKLDEPQRRNERPDVTVRVFEPGIELRVRRLTTTGAAEPIASADGKTIWATVSTGAGSQLVAIPVAGGAQTPVAGITAALNPQLSQDGRKLYYQSGGRLFALTLAGPPTPAAVSFNATFTVDRRAEETALFRDIVWAMERLYYDPELHGKNWPGIRDKFAQVVPFTYDRADFYELMGEMMEELDSSHLGATSPPEEVPGSGADSTGYLGVEYDAKLLDERGIYVVASVVPGSPAFHPDSQLLVGDRILEVDGVEPSDRNPISALLNQKANRRVTLKVERKSLPVTVSIRPASAPARAALQYEQFVAEQRSMVQKLSNGTIGYVHIRGMDQVSLDRFLRETRTEGEGKKAVIVDCRFNGGGSTAVQILGVLIRQPWLIRTTRGPFGVRLSENLFRSEALELPTALMVNTYSFSNAEVIAEGFRRLKLGPIVGERTPGYVIGTGGYGLWDGGFIRMPAIGAFGVAGDNLENDGRRPDHTVWFDPNAWATGRDLQLEKTVAELMRG